MGISGTTQYGEDVDISLYIINKYIVVAIM
jgi:hypothetical protein